MTLLCALGRMGFAGCEGRLQRAHWVPRQRLKHAAQTRKWSAERLAEALWDRRAWDWVCSRHHHLLDQRVIRLQEDQYPEGLREFCAEVDFHFRPREGWIAEHPKEAA
ncbi:MAG: hypothetical protein ACRDLD_02360 [Thermoleophilaceae bacterium]